MIRMGILGAARIAPAAVIKPAAKNAEVEIVAVAARDRTKAESYARKHKISRVHATYEALIADPEIDAIYNPLPNGLHGVWTSAALAAGKHVLCEKPFTNNAAEAEAVAADAAARPDLVLMEAFHYRFHPFAEQMREVVTSGQLGQVQRIETALCFPLPRFSDIRYQYDLGGGATMDAGCYAISAARLLAGEEPEVVSAQAKLKSPQIDRAMTAELLYPSGITGRMRCSMWSRNLLSINAKVIGDEGEMKVTNFVMPSAFGKITVRLPGEKRVIKGGKGKTYDYQLAAFAEAVLRGGPNIEPPSESIANMRVIDAIYTAAGLKLRGQ